MRAAELFAVLVDAELAAGALKAADAACDDLVPRADGLEVPRLCARTNRAAATFEARRAAAALHGLDVVLTPAGPAST